MTPSARLAAAATILEKLDFTRLVDPQLKAWARGHRFAGSSDRRAIADRVYTCLRRLRSCAAHSGGKSGRALVLGSLASQDRLDDNAIKALCVGGYGIDALTADEELALSQAPRFESEAARLDWPDWLMSQAVQAFGNDVESELDALRQRAPLDLRVNTLRTTVSDARSALAAEGLEASPVPLVGTALRLAPGAAVISGKAYIDGLVEMQDAASQAVAAFTNAAPEQTVLDFCAGAGGKTLALAALMENKGSLLAHDIDPARMAEIPDRAKRCGAKIERIRLDEIAQESCDTVLVDAPCSGSGSWRRDPLGKWRLTEDQLAVLQEAQRAALTAAARYVRPGGTLTYATCSILPSENDEQATWFADHRFDFTCEDRLHLWPARDGGDGFFAARFRRLGD